MVEDCNFLPTAAPSAWPIVDIQGIYVELVIWVIIQKKDKNKYLNWNLKNRKKPIEKTGKPKGVFEINETDETLARLVRGIRGKSLGTNYQNQKWKNEHQYRSYEHWKDKAK